MSAIEPFYRLFINSYCKIPKEKELIIEVELFILIYQSLYGLFKEYYKEYFSLMKFSVYMEKEMIDDNFIKLILNDLLLSETYSLKGVAYHIQEPEEVIYEIASGYNTNPSFKLTRKLIELHRELRPELYREVVENFINDHIKQTTTSE